MNKIDIARLIFIHDTARQAAREILREMERRGLVWPADPDRARAARGAMDTVLYQGLSAAVTAAEAAGRNSFNRPVPARRPALRAIPGGKAGAGAPAEAGARQDPTPDPAA